ncbi:MAG: E3 binding domain-containing protein [Acidobacteria bacterium]|nr:E3 binding domain-containing protein [Acidobacteriota bacterium]
MPVVIRMPDFGTAVSEIRLTRWLVEEGAAVKRGDLLAEIETDKAATELECIAEGVLLKRLAVDGALVESGVPIAWVGNPGEQLPVETPVEAAVAAPREAQVEKLAPKVAPIIANLAAKLGVDLARVTGSGDGGTITREDVIRAGKEPASKPVTANRVEPLSRAQAAVARAVEKSNSEIPHLRVAASLDMTAVEALRAELPAGGRKAFYDALLLAASL